MLKLLKVFFPERRPARAQNAVAAVAELGAQVPLPAGLAARLRAIPEVALGCDDVERLYAATERAARCGTADLAAERHLAGCARCREIYRALATGFRLLPVPLPARLRFRLAALRRPQHRAQLRPLPIWIADLRFAAAACALLTTVSVSALGRPIELLERADRLGRRAVVWQQEGERGGLQAWGRVATPLETALTQGKESLGTYGRMWEQLFDDSARIFVPQNLTDQLDRYLSSQGDDDGQPKPNP